MYESVQHYTKHQMNQSTCLSLEHNTLHSQYKGGEVYFDSQFQGIESIVIWIQGKNSTCGGMVQQRCLVHEGRETDWGTVPQRKECRTQSRP